MLKLKVSKQNTFLYYLYGSNMFSFRIHIKNPTAEFVSIGRLDNFRVDFVRYSHFWGGPTATIVPNANGHVWGVIWCMHTDDLLCLDEQESVDRKIYHAQYVDVLTPYIGTVKCRTYIQNINPLPRGDNDDIPVERWPSWSYKQVMIIGAMEHNLPEHYIAMLEKIKDNGEKGCFRVYCLLMRYAVQKPCRCTIPEYTPRNPLKLDIRILRKQRSHK